MYFVGIGPDFKKNQVINGGFDQLDISATIAEMLHFDMPTTRGQIIELIFN
jgi:hypothetical protein